MNVATYDLTGKVAIITGSTRGIGKAIAETMAHYGASVVITGRKQEACDAVANEIKAAGGIRTLDTALRMIELGVSRIGSTASVSIVEELKHRL